MKFTAAQAVQKGEAFTDALFNDLAGQVDELPLERFCTRGGWPLNARISTIAILQQDLEKLVAVLYVSFTESGAACCSGDNFEHERFVELPFEIDMKDWSWDFPAKVA